MSALAAPAAPTQADIHNHMLGESPRIVFLHFWGIGPAEKLAQGVKAGLTQTSTK